MLLKYCENHKKLVDFSTTKVFTVWHPGFEITQLVIRLILVFGQVEFGWTDTFPGLYDCLIRVSNLYTSTHLLVRSACCYQQHHDRFPQYPQGSHGNKQHQGRKSQEKPSK